MSSDQKQAASKLALCPSCGAAVSVAERSCWLCKWDLAEEIVTAEIVASPPKSLPASTTRDAMIAGLCALALTTAGVFFVAPGIGVLLGIVLIIALFACSKSLQEPAAVPPTGGQKDGLAAAYAAPASGEASSGMSVVAQVFKVLGIILLIGLGSIIAFLTFCVICIAVITRA